MIRVLTAASILLSAFLLFQIQPILARFALPWYGGSAAVWGACMLFFQALLFLGYLYAHLLSTRLAPRAQAIVHVALLAASLLLLPVGPGEEWKPAGDDDPMAGILALLAASIGLPYFLLSSTSPLAQAWLVRSSPLALPYRFYALSNLASLAGLLAYPLVVERLWTLQIQAQIWSAGYAVFVLLCSALAWLGSGGALGPQQEKAPQTATAPVVEASALSWILLAALPSALSLAVTNHLTQNVAAIPLLWILPLALYLLTLILCFDSEGWYRRTLFVPLSVLALMVAGTLLVLPQLHTELAVQLPAFSAVLFVLCMSLHGELVRRKPAGEGLTRFYLLMSLGGALGGLSVGLGAPYLLRGYYELPLALSACGIAILVLEFRRNILLDALLGCVAVWICASSAAYINSVESEAKLTTRNFYGGLRIVEHGETLFTRPYRDLVHGAIVHGSQFLEEKLKDEPTAYYARGTGADYALENFRHEAGRVGVIGLGTGAMAAYGRTGETYRYYELNPTVVELAKSEFSFLSDSAATVETVVGDGRLSLEREEPQGYSVLAVDAFSGDSIPVHLLSIEAFELYFRHLRADGVLAVHISNAVLNLRPVVAAAAEKLGKRALEITIEPDASRLRGESTWVLLAAPEEFSKRPGLLQAGKPLEPLAGFRIWTDGYSNLLALLK